MIMPMTPVISAGAASDIGLTPAARMTTISLSAISLL